VFDWVGDVLDWLLDVISQIFIGLAEMVQDLGVMLLEVVLDLALVVIGFLTLPTFLAGGLGSYLNAIDPAVLYFLSKSGISAGFELLGAGLMFRLTRKLLTLGQW